MVRILIPLLLLSGPALYGQSIKSWAEDAFVFKVKQIDEFIDRFNHAPHTLAVRQNTGLTHREDLFSLFDQEREDWDYPLIEAFTGEVLARSGQRILDFYDPLWYAELECTFLYRGAPQTFTLILQNQTAPNGGSRWVIVSILERLDGLFCQDIPEAASMARYLHPMSHASNFAELEGALSDKENLQNFFDPWNQGMDFLAFKHGLKDGSIQYKNSGRLSYHFLQLENWIFTLDYFPRKQPNAGWLISNLARASAADKKRYKAEKLNLL